MKEVALLLMILFPLSLFAQGQMDVNENEMFKDQNSIVDSKTLEKKDNEEEKKSLGVSGEITSANYYSASRATFKKGDSKDNQLDPYILGDVFLDARLPDGVKGFGSFEANYDARANDSSFDAKEMFVDFNLGNTVYFRTGKQVLQWGRCYLWNPTDLVNVEKKTFLQKVGTREGAYGLKIHVPFGTQYNMYGFIDTGNTSQLSDIAGAYKFEFLLNNTEMAFSVWGKKHFNPVLGYDISTRVMKWDIAAEAAGSYGSNERKIKEGSASPTGQRTLTTYKENDKIVPKASIDFGRSFDVGDNKDKISLNTEFFYNGDGYKKNIFGETGTFIYDKPVKIKQDRFSKTVTIPGGDKKTYLVGNNMYQPNYYSRYYAAIFTTINKFIISDLSLSLNLISNISQRSFTFSTGINYANMNNFKTGFLVNTYLGKKNTEYTFLGNGADFLLTAGIVF